MQWIGLLLTIFMFDPSYGADQNRTKPSSLIDLPEDVSDQIFCFLDNKSKLCMFMVDRTGWQLFVPFHKELEDKGLILKKTDVGMIYLHDEVRRNELMDLLWICRNTEINTNILKNLSDIYELEFDTHLSRNFQTKYESSEKVVEHNLCSLTVWAVIKSEVIRITRCSALCATSGRYPRDNTVNDFIEYNSEVSHYNTAFQPILNLFAINHLKGAAAMESSFYTFMNNALGQSSSAVNRILLEEDVQDAALGPLCYQMSEKVVLLYFIRHMNSNDTFRVMFREIYRQAARHHISDQYDLLRVLQNQWEPFKDVHLSTLEIGQRAFLQPVLDKLDRL